MERFDLLTNNFEALNNELKIVRDITSELAHKTELQREERLRTNILNAFKEVVAFYSPNHRILWLNNAAKKQLNITDDSYIGKQCYKVWFNADKPCQSCPIVSGKLETSERLITLADNRIWMVRHTPLFDNDETLTGFIEFRADITDDVHKEKKQKQVAADALYINQKNTILSEIESVLTKILADKKFSKFRKYFKKIFDIIDSYK